MPVRVNRRELIVALGGALVLPSATDAQETDRVRRIGVFMTGPADDGEGQSRLAGFLRGLQELGWTPGSNLQIDYRWANDNTHRRQYAAELIALAPEVILASTSPSTAALQQASDTVPIVFAAVTDPVGQGFVASLPHPGISPVLLFTNMASAQNGWSC